MCIVVKVTCGCEVYFNSGPESLPDNSKVRNNNQNKKLFERRESEEEEGECTIVILKQRPIKKCLVEIWICFFLFYVLFLHF